jgi:hypothetical protein
VLANKWEGGTSLIFFWDWCELFWNVPGLHKFCTEQIAVQKTLQNPQQKCSSCLVILRHFGTNSTGTFKASHSHNKNFGITQPQRLVKNKNVSTLFIEVPNREIGGQLTPWNDLAQISDACRPAFSVCLGEEFLHGLTNHV